MGVYLTRVPILTTSATIILLSRLVGSTSWKVQLSSWSTSVVTHGLTPPTLFLLGSILHSGHVYGDVLASFSVR